MAYFFESMIKTASYLKRKKGKNLKPEDLNNKTPIYLLASSQYSIVLGILPSLHKCSISLEKSFVEVPAFFIQVLPRARCTMVCQDRKQSENTKI